jgi:hypothetical protein
MLVTAEFAKEQKYDSSAGKRSGEKSENFNV